MSEKIIYLASCGCGFENGRTDRQTLACGEHYRVDSLAQRSEVSGAKNLPTAEPTFTLAQLNARVKDELEKAAEEWIRIGYRATDDVPVLVEAIRADREKLAGLVRKKKSVLSETLTNRIKQGNDTIVQDCKIDTLTYVLELMRTTPIGGGNA